MDDSVFQRLYEDYNRDVFNFLTYLTRNREVAEDLMHEVYVRVLKSYGRFEGKSSEKTWLFAIAKNVSIDYFRKQSTVKKHTNLHFDWETQQLTAPGRLPEQLLEADDEQRQVLKALDTCTGDQKMVILMRFFQDLTVAETAEILEWTESKVKTTQHRAIKSLKEKLEVQSMREG
ncbi:RNA polymerase sigma factor SigX [Sporosarcina sp. P37]|uniref:sigma-70 family RNA polymerase sigma factor n=1 Tax=unclassified Sporosarcina TaxID=2647733 RepID=UPI0009BDCA65|nr:MULTISPECIES: sigma-70 family RNA polymerase sigma factor [unclassified Sporosarcina]ARD49426.1 RNA polymerase sigma factor SigX [Sporosarcina sp. P33]ARK25901.1 RNA polymerase sigma factor SigX [Sporosarcina sp. P37]PID18279.1 RNA polymerase sigma factor SigX [Sporosarcina sp. P35]